MSEVFWADVSRVSESWWGTASAVMSLAMGLHALIFAGGGIPGCGPRPHLPRFTTEKRWLRGAFWTAFVGAYHIKGVLMPLAVTLAIIGACSMLASDGSGPPPWGTLFVLPLMGMLALFLPQPGGPRRPAPSARERKDPPQRWVVPTLAAGIWCVVGYVVPICGALVADSRLSAADGWRVGLVLTVLFGVLHTSVILCTLRKEWRSGWKQRVKQLALGAASVPWIVLTVLLSLSDDTSRVMSDLGSLLMSAYHLALGLAAFWVFAIGACCSAGLFSPAEERDRGKVIFLGYSLELSLWVAVVTTLACLAWRLPAHERLAWLGVEATYGPGTWFPLVPVVFVGILALSLAVWLSIRLRSQGPRPTIADLVGAWPLPAVTTTTALLCLGAATAALNERYPGDPPTELAMIGAVLPLLIPVVRWLRTPLHQGLDLATDVTAYFRGRSWASSTQHRTDERLKTRFRSAVQNLLEDGVDRLVVVAHSQGTVIAVDALRPSARRSQVDPSKVDLLTMGSPLQSLYAQFFPVGFGQLIGNVGPKVRGWVNLYRADDYVGQSLGLNGACGDRQIDGQGHEHYWTDASVLEELEKLIRA